MLRTSITRSGLSMFINIVCKHRFTFGASLKWSIKELQVCLLFSLFLRPSVENWSAKGIKPGRRQLGSVRGHYGNRRTPSLLSRLDWFLFTMAVNKVKNRCRIKKCSALLAGIKANLVNPMTFKGLINPHTALWVYAVLLYCCHMLWVFPRSSWRSAFSPLLLHADTWTRMRNQWPSFNLVGRWTKQKPKNINK